MRGGVDLKRKKIHLWRFWKKKKVPLMSFMFRIKEQHQEKTVILHVFLLKASRVCQRSV